METGLLHNLCVGVRGCLQRWRNGLASGYPADCLVLADQFFFPEPQEVMVLRNPLVAHKL
jgi:hypothetical protein